MKVKIKSYEELIENPNIVRNAGFIVNEEDEADIIINTHMFGYLGEEATITKEGLNSFNEFIYRLDIDSGFFMWRKWMLKNDVDKNGNFLLDLKQ